MDALRRGELPVEIDEVVEGALRIELQSIDGAGAAMRTSGMVLTPHSRSNTFGPSAD